MDGIPSDEARINLNHTVPGSGIKSCSVIRHHRKCRRVHELLRDGLSEDGLTVPHKDFNGDRGGFSFRT